MADHLPVLWSGLLVRLQSRGGRCGVHTRNITAGITLTILTKYAIMRFIGLLLSLLTAEHWSKWEMKPFLPSRSV